MSSKVYSASAKLKEEGRPYWSGQAQIYPLNYLLHVKVMLTIVKVFIILFFSDYGNREHPDNFENKSESSPFN